MAQTKTIQLLRSSQLYVPSGSGSEAKTALENAKAALTALTGRKDGEIVLARYQEANADIKSVLGIYHTTPNLPGGSAPGWTFIQDITSSSEGLTQLQAEIDRIESNVGLGNDGTYTSGYSEDGIVGTPATLKATVDNIITYIKTLDLAEVGGTSGDVITTVSQADGKVSASKSSLTDVAMTGYSKTADTGDIAATDTLEVAVSKLENGIAAATVKSTDKTVKITDNSGKDLSVNIDGTTVQKTEGTGALKSGLTIIKENTNLEANVREQYKLAYKVGDNAAVAITGAEPIKIYKDSSLYSVYLGHTDDTLTNADQSGESVDTAVTDGKGNTALVYIMHLENDKYKLIAVDVETFLSESEFKDGLQVNNGEVSVKIDSSSEKDSQSTPVDFLTVSSNGIKISGIKDEIDRKIAALDVTDTAVAGQYVSAVNETDGKVTMTRANVSEAVLNGYSKGSEAPATTAVAATDDVKTAISKLEWQVAAANAGVEALDAEVTSTDGHNVQVKVTEVDGKITAVNVTDNSINATDLSNAINALDSSVEATAADDNQYSVLTGVTETDGKLTAKTEVKLAAVAKTGAAADVSIADSGNLIKETTVEGALQEIAANVRNNALVSNDVIVVTPDTTNNNTKLSVTTGNGLEKTGTNSDTLSVKAGDGIAVDSNGVAVKAGAGLVINSSSKDVDVNPGNGLEISSDAVAIKIDSTSAKLGDGTDGMLTVSANGLKLADTWDCGVFD